MPPETLLDKLRRLYRAPDGKVIEQYNGSPFEPSRVFDKSDEGDPPKPGSRRQANPAQIQDAIDKIHQS